MESRGKGEIAKNLNAEPAEFFFPKGCLRHAKHAKMGGRREISLHSIYRFQSMDYKNLRNLRKSAREKSPVNINYLRDPRDLRENIFHEIIGKVQYAGQLMGSRQIL